MEGGFTRRWTSAREATDALLFTFIVGWLKQRNVSRTFAEPISVANQMLFGRTHHGAHDITAATEI